MSRSTLGADRSFDRNNIYLLLSVNSGKAEPAGAGDRWAAPIAEGG
jgi:hypothetical protein